MGRRPGGTGRRRGGHRPGDSRPPRGGRRRHQGDDAGQRRRRRENQPPPRHRPPDYVAPAAPSRPPELIPTDRTFRGLSLFPFQVAAVDAVEAGHSVLVSAPTGAGKTLVADYAIEKAFEHGWRAVYTSPIKALSNQKYRDFRAQHGDQVGIMTGDVTINPDGDLLIMTTEVFRNTLFDEPDRLRDFRFVIHDEVHYLDDPDRGTVWEESIIHAPDQMRMVCLSATIPNVREFAAWIETVRGEPVTVVEMKERPVPLDHKAWLPDEGPVTVERACDVLRKPFGERRQMRRERQPTRLLDWLQDQKLLPVLFFCFSRKQCEAMALDNRRRTLLSRDERKRMTTLFDDLVERFECARTSKLERLRTLAEAGVGFHHAGMLPVHKEIMERLFTSGLVRILFATETFALGVNMPARTVGFAALRKFDGERMDYMLCRSYGQMAGRAGRQGMDTHGLVVAMVDARLDKPRGTRRVMTGDPEPVISRWNPDYSTILALYPHLGDRVLDTYEKSFARFQRERRGKRKGGKPGRRHRAGPNEQRVLAARLDLLKRTGYIEDGAVTAKGSFASRVNGYEIQAAEWWDAGLLERLDERRLALLLLATIYEPRPDHRTDSSRDREVGMLWAETQALIRPFRKAEWDAGLTDLTPEPHFGASVLLERWMDGRSLTSLAEITTLRDGDVVRSFRLLLQLVRQLRKAVPRSDRDLHAKLDAVTQAVNRDEVDARRQLELGQDPLEEPDEATQDDEEFGAGL